MRVLRKNVYVRPYVHTLFAELFDLYDVALWSCNTKKYVDPISRLVFGKYTDRLKFVWNNSHCSGGISFSEYARRKARGDADDDTLRKDLDRIGAQQGPWLPEDIVLIDDTPKKMVGNGQGLIIVSPFVPSRESLADTTLVTLLDRINEHFFAKQQPQDSQEADQ